MESDSDLARVGMKRKADAVPMDISAPTRLKLNVTLILVQTSRADVANKLASLSQRITTTFPRFLDLPQELQIQCWEHAIAATIGEDIKAPTFGISLITTERMMARRVGAYQYNYLLGPGGKTTLLVPKFINIMAVSSLPRLIAWKWWKGVMEKCDVEVGYQEGIRGNIVGEIERLIRDVGGNGEGVERVEAGR